MFRGQSLTIRRWRLTLTWTLSPCNDLMTMFPRLPSTCCRQGPGYRWLISKFLSIFLVSSAQSCMPGWERESGRRRQVQGGPREKAPQLRVTHESRFPITVLITPLFAGCRVWAIEYNARVGNLSRIAFMTAAGLSRVSQSPDMER